MALTVVIPAHRASLPQLEQRLDELSDDMPIVVVTNGEDPLRPYEVGDAVLVTDTEPDINIYRWWALGIASATQFDNDVLILNADAQLLGDPYVMSDALRTYDVSVAFPDAYNQLQMDAVRVRKSARPHEDLRNRMTGYAFVMRKDRLTLPDTGFRWWYGDDDLEWRLSGSGGTAMVGQCGVVHPATGAGWPGMEDVIKADRRHFIAKWGVAPHNFGPGADE